MMQDDEFSKGIKSGTAYVRNDLIARLIGWQSATGNNEESEEYKAYQKVINYIESNFGKMCS